LLEGKFFSFSIACSSPKEPGLAGRPIGFPKRGRPVGRPLSQIAV